MTERPALDRATIVAAIETYCHVQSRKDLVGWSALFAEDVFYEDPVGVRQARGKSYVVGRIWDDIVRNDVRIWLTDDVIVCGDEALAILACDMGPAGQRRRMSPIVDQFRFDAEGRIASVRGFYNLP